jgi:Skp family chaperone for outer membrane proteins
MDSATADQLTGVFYWFYQEIQEKVPRTDFSDLKEIVRSLAEAQKRTEQRLEKLAQRVEELAEAQKRTEQRVEELAEAQRRTEQRVEELAEAQKRTEQRVEELAEAQRRTEQTLKEFAERTDKSIDRLNKQVGGLSDAIGGDIEDIAYIVLHEVLKREFGWQVGVLERQWQLWGEQPEEVNILGQATDPARPTATIWIVGEAKHNLTAGEVKKFTKQLERARQHLSGEIFPVCFCYRARPEVQQMIADAGIRLAFSYGKLV